jgi:DNA-binding NtrC family response regulator
MYEAFNCEVTLVTGVEQAKEEVRHGLIDVVVASYAFMQECGIQLHTAIKELEPDLCIAVLCNHGDHLEAQHSAADVFLRPTHFFSDLHKCGRLAGRP